MTQKVCVADAEYGRFRRRVDDLVRRVDEGTLELGPVADGVQFLIENGRFYQLSGNFRRDMRKEGWMLIENMSRSITSADIIGLPFLKDGEDRIGGEEMLVRSRSLACYGQEDAEWLLDHQDQIPVELRQFYLVFPRTVWKYRACDRNVPCLDWLGSGWFLYFSRLEDVFVRRDRLASPRR